MPVYDFKCLGCGDTFSLVMTIRERETKEIRCPGCNSPEVRPVYSGFFAVTSKKS